MNTDNTNNLPKIKTFTKIDMDLDPKPVTKPEPVVDWSGGAIMSDSARKAHVLEDDAAAQAAGFNLKAPVYEIGTAVVDAGIENALKSRREFEAMASVEDTFNSVLKHIEAEKREDVFFSMNKLAMTSSGHVGYSDNSGKWFVPTEQSFRHLTDLNGFGSGARYLWDNCSPYLRAVNVNNQLNGRTANRAKAFNEAVDKKNRAEAYERSLLHLSEDATQEAMFSRFGVTTSSKVVIPPDDIILRGRTRKSRLESVTHRELFAVTSSTYTPIDFSDIADIVLQAVHGDARATYDYFYDKAAGLIDIVFHSDIKAHNYSAGEIFKAFIRIKFDDARQGSVKITSGLWRNLCLNLIILDVSEIECGRVIHTGSSASRVLAIKTAVDKALESVDHFVTKWDLASKAITNPREIGKNSVRGKNHDVKSFNDCTTAEKVAGLVNGYIKANALPTMSRATINGITDAYFRDAITSGPAISKAGIVNAITRYANDDMDRWSADALERAAGGLTWNEKVQPTFQYVSVLAA